MTINFPMWLLDEPAVRCRPNDPDRDRKLSLIDRRAPFFLLYQSLVALGHEVGDYAPGSCDLNVFWTAKRVPDSERGRSIVMEVAWLPRSQYQVSPTGSNHAGHYATEYVFRALDRGERAFIEGHLAGLRRVFERRVNACAVRRLQAALPDEFVLFPLQLANDFNLKCSGTPFSRYYAPDDLSRHPALARACVEAVSSAAPGIPVVFKQHPMDPTPPGAQDLGALVLDNAMPVSSHDIFATGRCRAVVSVNSNTIHEAAVWNIPSICLGNLVWSADVAARPFPSLLADLPAVIGTAPLDEMRVRAYLHHLVRHQWTLTDFQHPLMVEELVRTRGRCEPLSLRRRWGLP